jgi:hypothetical protein
MEDVSSIHKPSDSRDSRAEQLRRQQELIAERKAKGLPTFLAEAMLALLRRP